MKTGKKSILSLAIAISLGASHVVADTSALVDELKQLRIKAKQERAADPWLLNDMDKLIEKYDQKTAKLASVVSYDFTQRSNLFNRKWETLSGEAWIDQAGLNLQADVQTAQQQPAQTQSSEEVAAAIFGAIIKEALDVPDQQKGAKQDAEDILAPAEVVSRIKLPADFQVSSQFEGKGSDSLDVDISFGLYQSSRAQYGYQLLLSGHRNTKISLIKIHNGRLNTLKTANISHSIGRQSNELDWRQEKGKHQIYMNGQLVLEHSTRSFKDDFREISISSQGRQVAIKKLNLNKVYF